MPFHIFQKNRVPFQKNKKGTTHQHIMKKNIVCILACFFLFISENSHAQQDTITVSSKESITTPKKTFGAKLIESNFHLGLELQTKYMWRDIEYGTAPILFAQINYSNWGLNIYAMGGIGCR